MPLEGHLVPVPSLTPRQRDRMYALMDRHYAGMQRDNFDSDLAEKQWAILLNNSTSGEILGFSTQMLMHATVDNRPVQALFSGDTIIDQDHWGQNTLLRIWGRLALDLIDQDPAAELYWFLIAKGYKTYRFLPLFFHEFHPRRDTPIPDHIDRVRSVLTGIKFPKQYDSARGIIEAKGSDACRLRTGIAQITQDRLRDPHVSFFNAANPGHVRGDELCCIAPLTRANFTRAAYRAIGKATHAPLEAA